MPIEIECPSGLIGKVRGLKGRDGRFLTDQSIARQGTLIDQILDACWEGTSDPGVYTNGAVRPDGAMNWGKVLLGDRMYSLIQVRIAGVKNTEYAFKVQCANRPQCGAKFEWEIDLDDLPVKDLCEESREKLKAGENDFTVIMPGTEETRNILPPADAIELAQREGRRPPRPKLEIVPNTGKLVHFRLPTGETELLGHKRRQQNRRERRKTKLDKKTNDLIEGVLGRVISIEGVDPGKRNEGLIEYLEDVDLADLSRLVTRFDEHDCGVETVIEIECPDCGHLQEIELPFDKNFFFPER